MEAITLRLESDTLESIDEEATEHDLSRSEYIRNILRTRDESDQLRDKHERIRAEYERQVSELERERDRLERKLTATNSRNDDITELVEYVEEQRELERYRDRRERMIDQAGVLTRAKWWLTGVPVDDRNDRGDVDAAGSEAQKPSAKSETRDV